jgi:hypothetical protein
LFKHGHLQLFFQSAIKVQKETQEKDPEEIGHQKQGCIKTTKAASETLWFFNFKNTRCTTGDSISVIDTTTHTINCCARK